MTGIKNTHTYTDTHRHTETRYAGVNAALSLFCITVSTKILWRDGVNTAPCYVTIEGHSQQLLRTFQVLASFRMLNNSRKTQRQTRWQCSHGQWLLGVDACHAWPRDISEFLSGLILHAWPRDISGLLAGLILHEIINLAQCAWLQTGRDLNSDTQSKTCNSCM